MGGQGVYDIVFKRIDLGASEVIRDFIELLDILYQHPETDLRSLLQAGGFNFAKPAEEEGKEIDSRFAEFTL